ncbi:MAG: MFS transporter [Pseudomonadota bacterium]
MKNPLPYSRKQLAVLLVCVGIFALGQFHRASGSIFAPILIEHFAISAATVGGLISAMFFATILSQMPFGFVLDKKGPRMVLTWCVFLIAFGTLVFALNYSFELSFLSRILIGVGLASMGAATHIIIARNFDTNDFGYVSGLVVTLGGIGGLLGTYPLAVALENLPWLLVFGSVGAVTVVLAMAVFFSIRGDKDQEFQHATDPSERGYVSLLKRAEFLKILALGFVTFAPIVTITGLWGGPFLQDVVGFSAEKTGAVLLLLFASTIVAGYTFGLMDKKVSSRRMLILVTAGVSSLSLLSLAVFNLSNAYLTVALLIAMVFFQQFYIPLGAHMRKSVPDDMLGRASTLLSLVSVAAIPLMQIGFGIVLDFTDHLGFGVNDQYRFAFAGMGILILLGGLIYSTSTDADDVRNKV